MLKFKKSLGQNLLIDKNIINKILSLSTVYKKNIVEIGPGTGNLTSEIIKKKPLKLILIEKDEKFIKILKENYEKKNNIKYVNKDKKVVREIIEVKPKRHLLPPKEPKRRTQRYLNEVATYHKNKAKFKAAEEYCKDRKYNFRILTEDQLLPKK